MSNQLKRSIFLLTVVSGLQCYAFTTSQRRPFLGSKSNPYLYSPECTGLSSKRQLVSVCEMSGFSFDNEISRQGKRDPKLSSAIVGYDDGVYPNEEGQKLELFDDSPLYKFKSEVLPVLSAALLITASTVGASCLVLPEVVAGPGIQLSSLLFLGAYGVCFLSAILIAEVAIKQYESSGLASDVPRSFQQLAEVNLGSSYAANLISVVSIFVNSCIMTFDFSKAGAVGSGLLSGMVEPGVVSAGVAAAVVAMLVTQSAGNLSAVASMCVVGTFVAFGALLIPGLSSIHDPMAVFMQPGTVVDTMDSVVVAAPVILTTMVYMNIVPSVAQVLNYDRTKVVTAIGLGSFLPLAMYFLWCMGVLGGGIDTAAIGLGGPVMTAFSLSTIAGSSVGTSMSVAQEVDNLDLGFTSKSRDQLFSLPAILVSIGIPLAAVLTIARGENFTLALSVAGSFGTPFLYGIIPALMAYNQRQKTEDQNNLVPGGAFSLAALGSGAALFFGEEIMQHFSTLAPTFAS